MDRLAEAGEAVVVNAAWQSAVIASIGIGAARLLRRAPARLRFLLVALTLVAAIAAPVMTLVPRRQTATTRVVATPKGTGDIVAVQQEPLAAIRPSLNRHAAEIVTLIYVAGLLLAAARLL